MEEQYAVYSIYKGTKVFIRNHKGHSSNSLHKKEKIIIIFYENKQESATEQAWEHENSRQKNKVT